MATNNRTCAFDGCEHPYAARGYCNGHYQQHRRGKLLTDVRVVTRRGMTLLDRLDMHTDKTGNCWLWTAGKNKKGYGNVTVGGKGKKAHRVAYTLAFGPIPRGLEIDHTCHNPACVRPAHLRLATTKQNAENRAGARSDSKSGVRGVHWYAARQKWLAYVGHNGRIFHLGSFATIEEAGAVARAKRMELFTHNDADRG